MSWSGVFTFGFMLVFTFLGGCMNGTYPEVKVSEDRLRESVSFLTEIEPARNYQNIESLGRAADYIYDKFREYGYEPVRQEVRAAGHVYHNIIASAGESDEGEGIFVVGAHYDVAGEQDGADDNASAVAGLLEAARLVKEFEGELGCRVEFAAYCLEEMPFFKTDKMGSYVHAKSLRDEGVKVKGMISLEMIGYFTDEKGSQRYPSKYLKLFYPDEGNFIAVVSNPASGGLKNRVAGHMKKADIDVRTLSASPSVPGVDASDHLNYWKFGYDAVMVTDTAFYRNPNYHEKSDTIDTLSFGKMAEVVRGVFWAILNL